MTDRETEREGDSDTQREGDSDKQREGKTGECQVEIYNLTCLHVVGDWLKCDTHSRKVKRKRDVSIVMSFPLHYFSNYYFFFIHGFLKLDEFSLC